MISCHWQSIYPLSSVKFFFSKLHLFFASYRSLYDILSQYLLSILGPGKYLHFSSARGALSFSLRQICKHGDEVIISSYTCIAVPSALLFADVTPVYVDVDPYSLLPDYSQIIDKISSRTRAIVIQHTLGNFCFPLSLKSYCRSQGIYIIEDCALSFGSTFNSEMFGSFGDFAIYSLELSKTLSTGWGGILRINDESFFHSSDIDYLKLGTQSLFRAYLDLFQTFVCTIHSRVTGNSKLISYIISIFYKIGLFRVSAYRFEQHGLLPSYFIQRPNTPQLVLLIHQLEHSKTIFKKVNSNFKLIADQLEISGFFVHRPSNTANSVFSVSNRVSFLADDKEFALNYFASHKITTGVWFSPPISPQPLSNVFMYTSLDYPNSNYLSSHVINLPCHSYLSSQQLSSILSSIKNFPKA